ncbi:MAG: hypothetical protein DMF11_10740, partial [Verrucomicrobia bacterium]
GTRAIKEVGEPDLVRMRLTFESLNTWDLFFLFPGRVYFVFWSLGSKQTKNPTGQKSFVCFAATRVHTEFCL